MQLIDLKDFGMNNIPKKMRDVLEFLFAPPSILIYIFCLSLLAHFEFYTVTIIAERSFHLHK